MATLVAKSKGKSGINLFNIANYLFLALFTFVTVYPFYNSIVLSFNEGKDAVQGGIYFFPRVFTLDNYRHVLTNKDNIHAAFITVSRTVVGTLGTLFLTAAFGYIISKPNLLFRKFYIILGVITLYFDGGMIPTYILIRNVGLMNNFWVYIFPSLFSMINAMIFMSFFRSLPTSLEESAKLDGASDAGIFVKIIIPISTPVLASIALFIAVGQWNSWYDTMLYTSGKPGLETLSNLFQKMVTTQAYLESSSTIAKSSIKGFSSTSLQLAEMVVTTAPIIAIYPFLQKYFVKGIMIGSVKG